MVTVILKAPIRLASTANLREHWATKAARTAEHRRLGHYLVHKQASSLRAFVGLTVTLGRKGIRMLDDDNLASAFKAIRDGVADGFKIKDNDPRVTWKYEQQKSKDYGIEIRIDATFSEG